MDARICFIAYYNYNLVVTVSNFAGKCFDAFMHKIVDIRILRPFENFALKE